MRRRKATVELFEEIRREYEFGVGTIQGVARKFGVHRRLIREAPTDAQPAQKVTPARVRPRLTPVVGFIDAILEADRRAPRKQRHTARRIYVRLGQERPGHLIAESTVRQYVRERKLALGLAARADVMMWRQAHTHREVWAVAVVMFVRPRSVRGYVGE